VSAPVENIDQQTEAPEAEEQQQGEELSAEALRKQLEKARREAANYRTKVRELEPLASKAKELEDAGRSDLEKLTARAEKAEQERAQVEARALRLEVAFEKGLTPAQAKRLVGASREELEADADEILRDFPALKPDGRPKGNADLGGREKAPPANPKQADLQQIEADLRAGRR
jgi:chromosome segregation ATPase